MSRTRSKSKTPVKDGDDNVAAADSLTPRTRSSKRKVSKSQRSGESSASPAKKPKQRRRSPSDALASAGKIFVGKRIAKYFDEDLFFGTIESVNDAGDDVAYYKIKYDDEDSEELDTKEVRDGLALYNSKAHLDKEHRLAQAETPKRGNAPQEDAIVVEDSSSSSSSSEGPVVPASPPHVKNTAKKSIKDSKENFSGAKPTTTPTSESEETKPNPEKNESASPKGKGKAKAKAPELAKDMKNEERATEETKAEQPAQPEQLPKPAEKSSKNRKQPAKPSATSPKRQPKRSTQQQPARRPPAASVVASSRRAPSARRGTFARGPDLNVAFPVRGARWRLQVGDITKKFNAATNEVKYLFKYEDGTTDTLDSEEEVKTAMEYYQIHELNDKYISTRVAKTFDGNPYFGTVVSYDLVGSPPVTYFRVLYDDGDEEEYDLQELQKWIRLYSRLRGNA